MRSPTREQDVSGMAVLADENFAGKLKFQFISERFPRPQLTSTLDGRLRTERVCG